MFRMMGTEEDLQHEAEIKTSFIRLHPMLFSLLVFFYLSFFLSGLSTSQLRLG